MFITFFTLYEGNPVKIDPESVVGLVRKSYRPVLKHGAWSDVYGNEIIGTNILLKGGHQVYVNSDIETVEKLLKGKKK